MKTQAMRSWAVAGALAVIGMCMGVPAALGAPLEPDAELAALFERLAMRAVWVAKPAKADVERSAALLRAARRCDPSEPRYAKLESEALLNPLVGDVGHGIEAINAFRKLRPEDQGSQLLLIDLYASRMESVDKRLAYLRDILSREAVAKEVRAAVALRCAALLEKKKQDQETGEMIETALKLDPLSWDALRWKLEHQGGAMTAAQRVGMLVAMARSNPADVRMLMQMGGELAMQGLASESSVWYSHVATVLMLGRGTIAAPPTLAADWVSSLVLSGRTGDARSLLVKMLQGPGQPIDLVLLAYLLDKKAGAKEADGELAQARTELVNVLEATRSAMGIKGAATRPAQDVSKEMPDVAGDAQAYKAASKELQGNYIRTLGAVAWFEAFWDQDAARAGKLLATYTALAGSDEAEVQQFAARVQGWIYLLEGKPQEAKVKLSAAATDAMARLGLVKLEADKAKALAEGQKLMGDERAGFTGAVIYLTLMDLGVKPAPGPEAGAVKQALDTLPGDWMEVLGNARKFYSLRAEPLNVMHTYEEPMLVRVTVQNFSPYDLTVGREGVIKPTLWFDAQTSEGPGSRVNGVCVESLTGRLVLHPREAMTQVVRIDQPKLSLYMQAHPEVSLALTGFVKSNPVALGETAAFGAAGYEAQFTRVMERVGFPVSVENGKVGLNAESINVIRRMVATAQSGTGAEKARSIELLAKLAFLVRGPQEAGKMDELPASLLNAIKGLMQDKNPSVRVHADYAYAQAVPDAQVEAAVMQMEKADAPWQERLLGLVAMGRLPVDRQKQIAAQAANDPEWCVKSFAQATAEVLARPAATQPSTQPSK